MGLGKVPLRDRFSGKVRSNSTLEPLKGAPPAPFPLDVVCVASGGPITSLKSHLFRHFHILLTARLGSHASLRRSTITAVFEEG